LQFLKARGVEVDLDTLEWDDPAVYALLQKGDTVGVFQLESEGMRRTLAAVRPTNFGDIIALVSLYRPGPMDNIPMFGDRKNGRAPIEYPHPLLEEILAETYGIFVYQEQVMQAAQVLAGYSLGEADLLRRAMGKKIKAEMDAQRSRFVEGCARNDIGAAKANELFDLIDKFAGYGFNKSHAAAYALIAYHTAWLKAHYKAEFYAASMCYDMHQTDKLAIFIDDIRRMGVQCLGPCINHSQAEYSVEPAADGELAVRYALGALKGVGEKAMEQLIEERKANGPFTSLEDFSNRIDPRLLNRRQLESLAGGGAFDLLEPERAGVFASAEVILAHASSAAEQRESGQGGLFGDSPSDVAPIRIDRGVHWTLADRMAAEKESFGFYFSSHPTDQVRHLADANNARSFAALCALPAPVDGGRVNSVMAALIEDARWRTSAKGKRYMMATCSDATGQFIATCFDDLASDELEKAAKAGVCALLRVELDWRAGEETPRVTVRGLQSFESMQSIRLRVDVETADPSTIPALAALVADERGGRGEMYLSALLPDGSRAQLLLGRDFRLDAELVARIERLPGMTARIGTVDKPLLRVVS
jgi:DNA polymerase-3 subunit alpha